ncbi:hypothetical protein J2801_002128 [Paraburkholderia phenoliruptrix]|uniref:hypothetical protein n=1 Tax=Paraburkholderia phenoliruptrix TaxID=252970 RepID=UPI002854A9AD|nr:hypothetical protein [Paraburkholderia phenoliruptrix]MDR6419877.1 hypothetical protein [Paraburkholderia phenoliruptrix]
MNQQYDGGIVKHYVEQFLQLGLKSHYGEDISECLHTLVDDAFKHLDIWVDGTPAENKARLTAQLKINADLIAASTPAQAKVLMDAHRLAVSKLADA